MPTLTESPPTSGRLRAAWTAAHTPLAGVPRWARIAAFTIPFTVLPSSVWRIAVVTAGPGEQGRGDVPSWLPMELYVVILSVVSELLAFTAVGLISTWGEVFPRWIPGLRGRKVPTLAVVIPAAMGAAVLTLMWTAAAVAIPFEHDIYGRPVQGELPLNFHDWQGVLAIAAYAPLLLWGPMLGTLTFTYWRRRRARPRPSSSPIARPDPAR